jgi:hypothetical protein
MSKMKEMDTLADKCTVEIIEKIYKTCDWALTGDVGDQLLEDKVDFNEAHSYLMQLVASKVAESISKGNATYKLRK